MQGLVTSEVMEDNTCCPASEESEAAQIKAQPQNNEHTSPPWINGQCVLTMPSASTLNPSFDLAQCRARLEENSFQIPVCDMEEPLRKALDVPSVRRYMILNSAYFHFMMAPLLYVVLWCAVFSTLHLYIAVSDYWVLCLCVSLVSIFLTTAIIFVLHQSNKEINMNLDVRLIQVNETMAKHKLLVAVADWVQNCSGNMQVYFVYWDMTRCLRALTEALEDQSLAAIQKKLKKRMSHLVLVTEVTEANLGVGGSDVEQQQQHQDSEEQRPLLAAEDQDVACSTSSSQRENAKVTTNYSLIPDAALPAQTKAYQLLMTYSAAYVKLLVSERLSGPSHHRLRSRRNHCTLAPLCLCQYIKKQILH